MLLMVSKQGWCHFEALECIFHLNLKKNSLRQSANSQSTKYSVSEHMVDPVDGRKMLQMEQKRYEGNKKRSNNILNNTMHGSLGTICYLLWYNIMVFHWRVWPCLCGLACVALYGRVWHWMELFVVLWL